MTRNGGTLVKIASSIAALVGMIFLGAWALDARFARAADLKDHLEQHKVDSTETKMLIVQNRRDSIAGRVWEIRRRGTGSEVELREMHALETDLLALDGQLEQYRQELIRFRGR